VTRKSSAPRACSSRTDGAAWAIDYRVDPPRKHETTKECLSFSCFRDFVADSDATDSVCEMLTRREWLSAMAALPSFWTAHPLASDREDRIRRIVDGYSRQGFHRTGTDVDRLSADWLCGEVRDAGLTPMREPFALQRVDPIVAAVIADGRRIEGVSLFDAAFTDAAGVRGRLSPVEGDGAIGLTQAAPNTAAAGPLGDARRTNRHRALVSVARGARPGLCPSNADSFLQPFGPPVVQVSTDDAAFLEDCARRGVDVQVIALVRRTPVDALNVTAMLRGRDASLPPLVVMTPRSGWWTCASERGGGIACWLELMRTLRVVRPARSALFVASSGHELGHLGINAFIERRPGIVSNSAGWIHFGANIGAAVDPGNTIQASDDRVEALEAEAMVAAGLTIDRRTPRGTIPGGEAEAVHRGGGRYVSAIGRSAWFHNPGDRGNDVVNAGMVARFVDAFTAIAKAMAA
jgi:hypothetical protein